MSRPLVRRALRRAGLKPEPRESRGPGPRSRGAAPPPRIQLLGEPENASGPLDFSRIFGNANPVELEVGSGRARFIFEEALAHPERNFLGAEIENDYVRIARVKIERLGITNLRIECLDGKPFVMNRMKAGSLERIHVYFPDPWPKKRHQKRRLFDTEFISCAALSLCPGGQFRVASDHEEYYGIIAELLDREPRLYRLTPEETGEWRTGTDYELRFLKAGRPFGQGIWARR